MNKLLLVIIVLLLYFQLKSCQEGGDAIKKALYSCKPVIGARISVAIKEFGPPSSVYSFSDSVFCVAYSNHYFTSSDLIFYVGVKDSCIRSVGPPE